MILCLVILTQFRKTRGSLCTWQQLFALMIDKYSAISSPCVKNYHQFLFFPLKIIFSQRATEDEWWNSLFRQANMAFTPTLTLMYYLSPTSRKFQDWFSKLSQTVYGHKFEHSIDEELVRKVYRKHNQTVLEQAPKEKLLVFEIGEGWQPLCDFLGTPMPSTPFPHKNIKGNISEEFAATKPVFIRMFRESLASSCLIMTGVALAVHQLYNKPTALWSLWSYVTVGFNMVLEMVSAQL